MSDTAAGLLQVGLLVALLAAVYRPLGGYLARVFTSERDSRIERGTYRLLAVDAKAEQTWATYSRSVLAFSAVGLLLLYLIQRLQSHLPLSLGLPNVEPGLAFNTAASFVANTNWQAYSPEATMGHLVQFAGLAVQNFLSAAVGITVAIAVIRGFARTTTDRLGNFWVDLTRTVFRVLLPMAIVGGLVLVAMGVVQNLSGSQEVTSLAGHPQTIPGGPVASQDDLIGQAYTKQALKDGRPEVNAAGEPVMVADPLWFQTRPSAVDYDGAGSAASQYGPNNRELEALVAERRAMVSELEGVDPAQVPPDALTASGSGLDPHISPAYAALQVNRVARERGVDGAKVRQLVRENTQGRTFGFLGEPRVNVVTLNAALASLS